MSNEITLFDYASLPINDAMELNAIKERIKIRLKRTAEDIIEIGKDLIVAKEKCGHGGFEKWLKTEFEMSQDSAQRFINVAKSFGDNPHNAVFDLKPTALYMLSAPSTPETVREVVIERIESGEKVDLKEIERLKKEAADLRDFNDELVKEVSEKTQSNIFLSKDLDEASKKIRFQALTVESVTKQNDELRNQLEFKVDEQVQAKLADERAKLILENQQAIAEEKRKAENAQAELERLKKEQAKAIKDGVSHELAQLERELDLKQSQIESCTKRIQSLRETELSLEREVGHLQTHKKAIEKIKDNLSFLTVSFSDAFDTNVIPAEVAGEWDAIYFALSKLKTQMSEWRDSKAPIEGEAIVGELVEIETPWDDENEEAFA